MSLNDLPNFPSAKNKDSLSGSIVICPSLDYAEKAYDEAKYGRISENPILELRIPSLLDENLAPKGKHNISITYRYAPFHLNQSDWDTSKDELLQNAINNIEIYAPGFAKLIEKSIVISPLDYEREYGLTEGSLTQGQMSLDQLLLMRPVPGFAGYRSPISALYLCGPAMHPGGGLSGMPGRNAAKQVISEFNQ
jgi:phytoene dehydrogenase-like protein